MAMRRILDKLEDVVEGLRGEYKQGTDGKWMLDLTDYEDPAALKSALQAERKAKEALEKEIKAWKRAGKTPDEIDQLIADRVKSDEESARAGGEWDKLKQQMNEKHATELKARDAREGSLRSSLETQLVDAAATRAISEAKGITQVLLPHVKAQVKVVEKDGQFSVIVVDPKGDPRVNGKGEPLSMLDVVSEMRSSEVFGRCFEGTGTGGSGTRPSTNGPNGAKTMKRADFEQLPAASKVQVMRDGVVPVD